MGLLTKPIETAIKERDKATADAAAWIAKAAAVRGEADALDAGADAAILADESAAERITLEVTALQRKARAYEQAAKEASDRARQAASDALGIEADELDKEAAKVRRTLDKHKAEVAKAKAALEDLAGHGFIPGELEPEGVTISVAGESTPTRSGRIGKASQLGRQALHLETQAQVIRFWLEDQRLPRSLVELNERFGPKHDTHFLIAGSDSLDKYGEPVTENLRAAIDAEGE